jgi:hypothetical protein
MSFLLTNVLTVHLKYEMVGSGDGKWERDDKYLQFFSENQHVRCFLGYADLGGRVTTR